MKSRWSFFTPLTYLLISQYIFKTGGEQEGPEYGDAAPCQAYWRRKDPTGQRRPLQDPTRHLQPPGPCLDTTKMQHAVRTTPRMPECGQNAGTKPGHLETTRTQPGCSKDAAARMVGCQQKAWTPPGHQPRMPPINDCFKLWIKLLDWMQMLYQSANSAHCFTYY